MKVLAGWPYFLAVRMKAVDWQCEGFLQVVVMVVEEVVEVAVETTVEEAVDVVVGALVEEAVDAVVVMMIEAVAGVAVVALVAVFGELD